MKKYIVCIMIFSLASCQNKNTNNFVISNKSSNTNIYLHKDSDKLVKWAVNDLGFFKDTKKPQKSGFGVFRKTKRDRI